MKNKLSHTILAIICLLGFSDFASAQNRPNYQLLWRIEGNGLKQPSYLFGTMHVKDSRAFQFSDSVYQAIEKCEGFALEVHPDSLYKHTFTSIVKDKNENYFRDYAEDDKEFEEFARRFTEETGLGLDQLNYTDPWTFDMIYSGARTRYDDFPVFVDAWLYRTARDQGKIITGVETMEDHSNLFESLDKNQQREVVTSRFRQREGELEEMIQLYYQGNIDSLMEFMEIGMTAGYKHALLTKRNYIMAHNMDSLSHLRPTFFAVGSGHLPGEEGVIQILRDRGFKLSAVRADFTGFAQSYEPERQPLKWETFSLADAGVRADFPGTPFKFDMFTEMQYYTYHDLGTGRTYNLLIFPLDVPDETEMDGMQLASVLDNMSSSDGVKGSKIITKNGMEVGELIMKQQGLEGIFRTHVMVKNGMLYLQMIGTTINDVRSDDAIRYLNSVEFFEPNASEVAWTAKKYDSGAFSLELPGSPTYDPNISYNNGYGNPGTNMHNYELTQNATKTTYFFQYYDQPPGYYAVDSASNYDRMYDWLEEYESGIDYTEENLTYRGLAARKVMATTEAGAKLYAMTMQRGNRTYFIYAFAEDSMQTEGAERYINSFQLYDYAPSKMEEISMFDSTITTVFADNYFKSFEGTSNRDLDQGMDTAHHYAWMDPNNGTTMTVYAFKFNKYKYIAHPDSVLRFYMDDMLDDSDSVISETKWEPTTNIPASGLQAEINYADVGTKGWNAVLISGNMGYQIFLTYSPEIMDQPALDQIKNNFSFTLDAESFAFNDSTITRVLEGLKSVDEKERRQAAKAIKQFPVKPHEAEALIKAAEVYVDSFKPSEDEWYNSLLRSVLSSITKFTETENVGSLVALFQRDSMPDEGRTMIIRELADIETDESLTAMLQLYSDFDKDSRSYYGYSMIRPFMDSVDLCRNYYPQLMELLPDQKIDMYMAKASLNLLKASKQDSLKVLQHKPLFVSMLEGQIDSCLNADDNRPWGAMYNNIRLLSHMGPDEQVTALFRRVLDIESSRFAQKVAHVALLKMGEEVPLKYWETMRNWDRSYEFYKEISEAGLTHLLPEGELDQEKVAGMMLRKSVEDDYGSLKNLMYLTKMEVDVLGEKKMVYVYRIQYSGYDNSSWYTAISGFQPMEEAAYSFDASFIRVSNEPYDMSNYTEQAQTLIDEELQFQMDYGLIKEKDDQQ